MPVKAWQTRPGTPYPGSAPLKDACWHIFQVYSVRPKR